MVFVFLHRYGFRNKPYLWLSAKPKLGTRQVTITHITDYIEKKLELEFQVSGGFILAIKCFKKNMV